MANSIGLNMKMTASISQFQKQMSAVGDKLQSIEKHSKSTAKGMQLLAAIEVGKLAVKGLSSLAGMFRSAASSAKVFFDSNRQAIDALGKMSDSTGIGAESLQVLGRIAEEQGVPLTALSGGFGRMNKRLAEANQGFGEALKPLQSMGFNISALAALKPEQQFLAITKAIAKLPTHGQKAAMAFKIFSDQGLQLFPMFDGLEEKVAATSKEMNDLGQILSTKQVDAVESMNDAMHRVQETATKLGQQVLSSFAPMIEKANTALLQFVKNFKFDGEIGGVAIAKFLVQGFKQGVVLLAKWADSFYVGLKTFAKAASAILLPIASSLNDFVNRNDFQAHESTRRAIDSAERFAKSLDKSDLGLGKWAKAQTEAIPPITSQKRALEGLTQAKDAYRKKLEAIKTKPAVDGFVKALDKLKHNTDNSTTLIPDYLKAHNAVSTANHATAESAKAAASGLKNVATSTMTAGEKLANFTLAMEKRQAAGQNPANDPILRGIGQNLQAEAALETWNNVANKIMSQYESMGLSDYARAQLQQRMEAERGNYVKFVQHKQGLEAKYYERRQAREQRAAEYQKKLQAATHERLGLGIAEGFLTHFGNPNRNMANNPGNVGAGGNPQATPQGPTASEKELQKQTPILQQIRDAIKGGNEMVLTSIA
ncbi:MAG: hypothetical protein ISR34_09415 [Pirellulales bacterium]|nr:hypothetical protein [Pirellulales bacterium]